MPINRERELLDKQDPINITVEVGTYLPQSELLFANSFDPLVSLEESTPLDQLRKAGDANETVYSHQIDCGFEALNTTEVVTEENEPCGAHYDQFAAVGTSIAQLITYDGNVGVVFAAGNEIRMDVGSLPFDAMDPESVLVGCFVTRNVRNILNTLPSGFGLPFIDDLINLLKVFLIGQTGALINPAKCEVNIRVTGMADLVDKDEFTRLEELRASGKDTLSCPFEPAPPVILGLGLSTPTMVQKCDIKGMRPEWTAITRLTFNRTAEAINLGASGTGSLQGVIDKFRARGKRRTT